MRRNQYHDCNVETSTNAHTHTFYVKVCDEVRISLHDTKMLLYTAQYAPYPIASSAACCATSTYTSGLHPN